MRIGLGFDVHNTKPGRPLIIGGVVVPCEFGLDGDSDADVLCHSIIDAVLGALNLGDIGSHFGVGTPDVMGAESLSLLARLTPLIEENRMALSNLDCTIIAQYPRLSDKREQMRENISKVLQTPQNRISLKFTTPKGLGPLGNKEGIACLSAILLEDIMVDKEKIESIKQLIVLAKELGIAQLSYEDEDINVAFELEGCGHEHFEERFERIEIPQQKMPEEKKPAQSAGNTFAIESPLSGTYYASPAPGADAFVVLGQIVNPGDTLCIVEAMKVMNEIVTDRKGRIVDMYYTSGQEVGAGSPLFVLEEI